ncbi:HTH domain-containing protein, partial [Listeria welshimeri]|nr:HTH domain-containing protein [Listeria welshimeri]
VKNKYIDEVINDYLNTNLSIVELAKKYNISRPTVYNYLQRKSIPKRK